MDKTKVTVVAAEVAEPVLFSASLPVGTYFEGHEREGMKYFLKIYGDKIVSLEKPNYTWDYPRYFVVVRVFNNVELKFS